MYPLILILHVLVSVLLIATVLIQRGKGASIGAAFGSGASQTVFGSQGSGSFLFKVTGFLAAVFFITTMTLGYMRASQHQREQQFNLPLPVSQQMPAQTQSDTVDSGNDTLQPVPASLPTE